MDQATELDDAEENRQQHERHNQHSLERFLSALPAATASAHDVCVSRCTIWPIFATSPLFHAMMPTTRVPRMMAAPITHSRVDCPRFKTFICPSMSQPVTVTDRAASSKRPPHDAPEERHHDQDHELRQVDAA